MIKDIYIIVSKKKAILQIVCVATKDLIPKIRMKYTNDFFVLIGVVSQSFLLTFREENILGCTAKAHPYCNF